MPAKNAIAPDGTLSLQSTPVSLRGAEWNWRFKGRAPTTEPPESAMESDCMAAQRTLTAKSGRAFSKTQFTCAPTARFPDVSWLSKERRQSTPAGHCAIIFAPGIASRSSFRP